jgi:hypothetical protein
LDKIFVLLEVLEIFFFEISILLIYLYIPRNPATLTLAGMALECDLTCTEVIWKAEDDNPVEQAQALLRTWSRPAFLSAVCMGMHERVGAASPLRLLDPLLAREICARLQRISLSEYLERGEWAWDAQVFLESYTCGPLGFANEQVTCGEMVYAGGGAVLQVFVGNTDGDTDACGERLMWRVDFRLGEIEVPEGGSIEVQPAAMTVETNAPGWAVQMSRTSTGTVRSSGASLLVACGMFYFRVFLLPGTGRTTRTSNAEFFAIVDVCTVSALGGEFQC